jgi:gliding motility-associated-like protein
MFKVKSPLRAFLIFLIVFPFAVNAQLTLTSGLSATQMATILAGPGVQISNAVITSPTNYYSSFNASGTNLGLTNGLLLTTGDYSVAVGPNNQQGAATVDNNPGDATLQAIAGVNTYDAAVLEFDFIPQNDTIEFKYIFASEEYPEYVCSTYNDLFGFFISGPGIAGTQNLAIIPGTSTPVAINAVNSGTSGANSNPGTPCNLSYSNFYVDNSNGTTIQYDGFTTVLTALAIVVPCQTYHLKIVVTDAGDADYDSGVFLQAGSLSSTPKVNAGIDASYCTGATHHLGIPPAQGWTYSWSPTTNISNPNISNPTVSLTNTGTTISTITYVLTGTNGTCVLKDTVVLTTVPIAPSTFTPPPNICAGDTVVVSYTGGALATASYIWSFPGGSVLQGVGQGPVSVIYSNNGSYAITLDVHYNGCPSSQTTDSLQVFLNPLAQFNAPDSVCVGELVTFQNSGSVSSQFNYSWSFGSGSTIISGNGGNPYTVKWQTPGMKYVTFSITNQICVDTYTDSIFVKANPVANITGPNSICETDTVQINFSGSTAIGNVYTWDFNSAQLISGSGQGPYQLVPILVGNNIFQVVVDQNGCKDTAQKSLNVIEQPIADFTNPTSICAEDSVHLNFTGNSAGGAIRWFISGGTPGLVNGTTTATSQINSPGTHLISLDVNHFGCISTKSYPLLVKPNPIASISSVAILCSIDTMHILFDGTADISTTYYWNFGGMTLISGSGAGPLLLKPSKSGSDSVAVLVNQNGCLDSTIHFVNIIEQPKALFTTPNSICNNDTAIISYNGINPPGASILWNLIGGNPALSNSDSTLAIHYSVAGSFPVSLTITNGLCRDSVSDTIIVNPLPLVDFTASDVCDGVPVTIQNNSSISSGNINSYSWSYGDSQSSSLPQPGSHTYSSSGDYTIVLAASSDKLCRDTLALNLTIHDNPNSNYNIDSICAGNATTFIDSSYIATGTIDHRYFYYNNSIIGIDSIFNYTFNGYGSYPTMLVTESDFGCRDTSYQTAIVHSLPTIDLTGLPRSGCQPLDVQFENHATNIDGTINNIIWNFGDGDTSDFYDPLHTYLTSGLFDVSLTAISEYGCSSDSIFANYIEVYPKPIADFIHDPAPADMLSPVVYFTNQTTLADQYLWNLGDSTVTTESDPVHQYNAPGTYLVELITTNDDGCKDTVTGEVIINPSFTLYVPNAFSPNNDGKNDVFLCQGTGIDKFKMKIFSRWGNHVCTLYNIDEPWDGTDDGKVAQEETYVYLIEVTDVLKQIHTVTGRVSIIK